MTQKPSKSPKRNTFQKNAYIERCLKDGSEPSPEYLALYEDADKADAVWAEEEHDADLEYDLRTTEWILAKARNSEVYAQNLYAAMCNNKFQKNAVWQILSEETWSCSWRSAGGIIADMLQEGDYIDWYCSGIRGESDEQNGFVPESVVTDEIRQDLANLGWSVRPYDDDEC